MYNISDIIIYNIFYIFLVIIFTLKIKYYVGNNFFESLENYNENHIIMLYLPLSLIIFIVIAFSHNIYLIMKLLGF